MASNPDFKDMHYSTLNILTSSSAIAETDRVLTGYRQVLRFCILQCSVQKRKTCR